MIRVKKKRRIVVIHFEKRTHRNFVIPIWGTTSSNRLTEGERVVRRFRLLRMRAIHVTYHKMEVVKLTQQLSESHSAADRLKTEVI